MKNQKSFVIYSSWKSYFDLLDTPEQVRELIYAMFDLAEGNEVIITDNKVKTAFKVIEETMLDNMASYQAKCEKNRRSAEKRWNDANGMQSHANAMRSHSDNDYANANDNKNDNEKDDDNDYDLPGLGNTNIISVFEVMQTAEEQGVELPMNEASAFIDYYFVQNHGQINGEPIRNWKNLIRGWYNHMFVDPRDVLGSGDIIFKSLPEELQKRVVEEQIKTEYMITRATADAVKEYLLKGGDIDVSVQR